MKTIITYVALAALMLSVQVLQGQQTEIEAKIERFKKDKEDIINAEKEALRKEVEAINERLVKDEITIAEAQKLKEKAAKKHALNIENSIAIIDNKIELLDRNKGEDLKENRTQVILGIASEDEAGENLLFGINIKRGENDKKKVKYDRRTYSNFVIGVGLNNAIVDGQSLDDSDYRIAGSRFFELGYTWTTRIFNKSNFARIKYGISYQSNGLKPTGNRFFVENGNRTELQEFPVDLEKSKFRMDNLVIPFHLEFGASKVTETDEKIRYSIHRQFRFGLGGYAGANISTRQKLKYEENGDKIKDKIKRDYNTNDLIYGVSGYIGFGDTSLYIKYDLNPIFRDPNLEQKNISLGLRFDL